MDMEAEQTTKERERAFEAFCEVVLTYQAAQQALSLMSAMPDANTHLATQLKVRRGMPQDGGASLTGFADDLLEMTNVERERGFRTLRGLALVAICGALEYLLKAVLVDQASGDVDKAAALLAGSRVKLSASEVLGLSQSEQWFVVADQLFKSLGEGSSSMHRRAVRFLVEFAHLPKGADQKAHISDALSEGQVHQFDEAFLVRNCLVHNGGRISGPLARLTGQERGSLIRLGPADGSRLITPMRIFAQTISSVRIGHLDF
jgi:hypothetical protein